jgi:hypothetical protein
MKNIDSAVSRYIRHHSITAKSQSDIFVSLFGFDVVRGSCFDATSSNSSATNVYYIKFVRITTSLRALLLRVPTTTRRWPSPGFTLAAILKTANIRMRMRRSAPPTAPHPINKVS